MVKPNTNVLAANPEMAATVPLPQGGGVVDIFSGGGGFSDLFPVPQYQKAAVKQYLKNHNPGYPTTRYNATGMARGMLTAIFSVNPANKTLRCTRC